MTVHALNDTKRHDFRLNAYGAFYSPTYAGSRSRVLDAEAQSGAKVESPVTSGLRGLNSGGRTDLFRSRKRHAFGRAPTRTGTLKCVRGPLTPGASSSALVSSRAFVEHAQKTASCSRNLSDGMPWFQSSNEISLVIASGVRLFAIAGGTIA